MPWSNNPYCTLADVKSALDLTSTTQDTWLQTVIDDARSLIDEELGYRHQTVTETRYYDGNDMDYLMVGDCVSFTQVLENGVDNTTRCYLGPYNSDTKYKLVKTGSDVSGQTFGAEFSEGRRNISVTGTFGRSTVPSWLHRINVRLAIHWVKMQDSNYADSITNQGGSTLSYRKPIPPDVREVLNLMARRSFKARS